MRLPDYDYRSPGGYFVTICTVDKRDVLESINDGIMHLSKYGEIAARHWANLGNLYMSVNLDCRVVMPNHIHGILILGDNYRDHRGVSRIAPGRVSTRPCS